jgi:hypothetical protein
VDSTTSLVFLVPVVARVDHAVPPTDSGLVLLICGFPLLQDYSGQSHLTVFLLLGGTSGLQSVTALASRDDLVVVGSLLRLPSLVNVVKSII